jgi:hypothetical protein
MILALLAVALFGVAASTAMAGDYGHHYKPKHEYPKPPVTPPVTPPTPPRVCPDGLPPTPGEQAYDPNDDCKRPPKTTTTPPAVVTPPTIVTVTVPGPERVVTKTVVKTKVKTKIKWRTKTKIVYVTVKPDPPKTCKSGYRMWKGKCHPIARGSG